MTIIRGGNGTFGRCLLAAALLIIPGVFQAKDSSADARYAVYDSGVWAARHGPIYWLDNDRVLFLGSFESNKARQHQQESKRLAIWRIGKGVTAYAKFTLTVPGLIVGGFCYSEGTISYAKPPNLVMYGRLDHETPIELDPKKKYYRDEMNCRLHEVEALMAQRKNRAINPLLDRHGYIDKGPLRGRESLNNDNVVLHKPGSQKPVLLPLRRRDIHHLRYYAFKEAYYTDRVLGAYVVTGKPASTYWLHPDGNVEQMPIPIGPWANGPSELTPSRPGVFVTYYAYKSPSDPGLAGGYLVQGQQYKKVINGLIGGAAVSPDGCKIAFSHAPYDLADDASSPDPARRTLKMINVCVKENNNG